MAEQNKGAASAQPALPLDVKNPEVQAAIAAAVAEQMAKLGPAAFMAQPGQPADSAFAHSLALALAEFNEQGGGKKYVDPKILKTRREANERMWELIREAHIEGKVATYGLTHKVVLADQLIEPFYLGADRAPKQTTIDWNSAPNGAMVPLNDTAKAIHAAFRESVGSTDAQLPHQAMAMTPGGLVVHGGAASHQKNAERLSKLAAATDPDGLSIHHKDTAGGKPMHILGTIAPPAQMISPGQAFGPNAAA